jgi:uncharacterized protein (TIGR02300 family)
MDAVRKEKLGHKWVCFGCGSKFYDLNRPEPLCPRCGKCQNDAPVIEVPKRAKAKRDKANGAAKAAKRVRKERETGLKLSNEEEELAGSLDAKLDDELDDDIDDEIDIVALDGAGDLDEADFDEVAEEEVV